jgi:septal ring factor EnvC (AmiA/AmiB activator)
MRDFFNPLTATNSEKVARNDAAIVAAHERRAASLAANVKAVRDALAARAARAARAAKIAAKQAKARPTRSHKKKNSSSRNMTKKHFSAHPHRFTRIPISTRRNRQ